LLRQYAIAAAGQASVSARASATSGGVGNTTRIKRRPGLTLLKSQISLKVKSTYHSDTLGLDNQG
jgi:hypothetical protein